MKNIVIIALMIFMSAGLTQAQDFRFGFTVEPTSSWVTSNDTEINKDGGRLGFKFGVIGEYELGNNFGLTGGMRVGFGLGGALKHKYGGKLLPDSELTRDLAPYREVFADNTVIDYNVGIFELPLSFKMHTNQIGYLRYFAEFPIVSLGFLTKATADVSSSDPLINGEKENVMKDVSTLFINWGVGAGIEYEVSSGTAIVAGIYYNANLNDFTTDEANRVVPSATPGGEPIVETEDSKGVLRQISLRVGVKF